MRAQEFIAEAKLETLKKNKISLTDDERKKVMGAGAVWHHGRGGKPTPAVWKGTDINGKTWYACNTHRACAIEDTLEKAIKEYKSIKATS